MQDFVESLLKKDDDAEILEQSEYSVTVDSSVLMSEIDDAIGSDNGDGTTGLETEFNGPNMTVPVKVLRTVAVTHTSYTFLILLWGVVPYYFFRSDVSTSGLEWILLGVGITCMVLYGALCFIQAHVAQIVALGVWMFLLFMCVNLLAAILKNLSPFQAVLIHFCQGLTMTMYCFLAKRRLDAWWCCGYMVAAGLVAWLVGFVAFLHYNDWITSFVLLLVFVIGSSVYSAWQVTLIRRFNISVVSQVDAVRHFYVDLLLLPLQWIRRKIESHMDRHSEPASLPPTLEKE